VVESQDRIPQFVSDGKYVPFGAPAPTGLCSTWAWLDMWLKAQERRSGEAKDEVLGVSSANLTLPD